MIDISSGQKGSVSNVVVLTFKAGPFVVIENLYKIFKDFGLELISQYSIKSNSHLKHYYKNIIHFFVLSPFIKKVY